MAGSDLKYVINMQGSTIEALLLKYQQQELNGYYLPKVNGKAKDLKLEFSNDGSQSIEDDSAVAYKTVRDIKNTFTNSLTETNNKISLLENFEKDIESKDPERNIIIGLLDYTGAPVTIQDGRVVKLESSLIGLDQVNNTSDADKPISTATQAALNKRVEKVDGKGLSTNDFTTAEKTKLANIAAEANKYILPVAADEALGGVKIGYTENEANKDYPVKLDNYNRMYVHVGWENTTYLPATASLNGLMSTTDKQKLDSIEENANNYTLPSAGPTTLGGIKLGYTTNDRNYKVTLDANGNAYVNVPWTNTDTTYSAGANITLTGTKFSLTDKNVKNALGYTPQRELPVPDGNDGLYILLCRKQGDSFDYSWAESTQISPTTSDNNFVSSYY